MAQNRVKNLGLLNRSRNLNNALRPKESADLYRFSLNNRSSFSARLQGLKQNADLLLLNQNRRPIAASRKPGRSAESITTALEPGTYYLQVKRRGKDTPYRLQLGANGLASPQPQPQPQALTFLSTSNAEVGWLDRATGVLTPLNTTSVLTDIARSNQGELFGITSNRLNRVDSTTGAITEIGSLNTFGMNGLAFSPTGALYGTGNSGFYSINAQTGAATLVANIPGFLSSGDLVFDPVRNRFLASSKQGTGTDQLYGINLDGTSSLIGNIGFSNVFGLSEVNGTFYGYTVGRQQIRIDPVTGQGTFDRSITGTSNAIYGAS
ncbi:MAG: lactonase family protein [Elainella sp. Prado103]|jgi:hypothetical protein|nr:lactonase family protein [Elainella sp. Prado103]